MPRLPLSALRRRIPWLVLLDAARWLLVAGQRGWSGLGNDEQTELARLLRKSKGRRGALTDAELAELQRLVRKGAGAAIRRS